MINSQFFAQSGSPPIRRAGASEGQTILKLIHCLKIENFGIENYIYVRRNKTKTKNA